VIDDEWAKGFMTQEPVERANSIESDLFIESAGIESQKAGK
jgi:hypothetical protein